MKVSMLTDRVDKGSRGVSQYIANLVPVMDDKINLELIHYYDNSHPIYNKTQADKLLPAYTRSSFKKLFANLLYLRRLNADLLHIPEPLPIALPFLRANCPKVVTIHDLAMLKIKRFKLRHNPKRVINDQFIRLFLNFLNKADMIITVSESSKRDIMGYLGIPESKIRVIYLAPKSIFAPKIIETKYPFILSNGINSTLIEVYYKLRKLGIKHKLVVFGAIMNKQLEEKIRNLVLQNDIILYETYLPDEEIANLYNSANLFIRYRKYEGFGLPPLEAMACRCPVIASNVGSLPEVVGDAGLVVNNQINEWTDAIYRILTDERLKNEMSRRGLRHSRNFTWDKTVRKTMKVYKEVLK